jgi:putative MFS transporter
MDKISRNTLITIAVAALGYFVDIYDLILFSIVRLSSLRSLGLSEEQVLHQGLFILNMQMLGMLVGGVLWGVLGDKKGRQKVLFGSILLYSVANFANAYVETVSSYAIIRFIAGIGLAGELGAGITLVAECMPKTKRGYGTSLVAAFGVLGAVAAYALAQVVDWRTCFQIGGIMGLCLLALRVGVLESSLYHKTAQQVAVKRGQFLSLFTSKHLFTKYIQCIGIGIPSWFLIGILITFSNEFAKALGIQGTIDPARAVVLCYIGLSIGDVLSGLVSQWLQSRKKTLYLFYTALGLGFVLYFTAHGAPAAYFYALSFYLGVAGGFWAIFVTMGAEQFGTNLRATVATTVPNFVRGALPLITLCFTTLQAPLGFLGSGAATGALCLAIAFWSAIKIQETFHQDLDYFHDAQQPHRR